MFQLAVERVPYSALAWRLLGWPAPAVSVALGFGAYLMARARGK